VFVLANPAAVRSQTTTPAGFGVVATSELYSGVEYVKLAKTKGPVVAHVAHVLPGAPVDLQVVNAYDRISTSPKELETTSSMCERTRCIVGVNGDFHKIGVPAGAVVAGGRMLHSPEPDRPQLTVLRDGRLVAGTFPWTGSLTPPNGSRLELGGVNAAPPANGLAVFTPEYGPATDASSRVELVVRATGVGSLNQPTNVEVVSLRTGGGPIPADGAVFSGDGLAGQHLRDLWARRQSSGPPARLLIASPLDARFSLGVEPVVLRDSKRALPWRDPNVINPRQPHTLVGWNKEGHVYLVAVDGRQPASEGVSMAEAADFLVSLGVTDAVSLDGGGGTTFVAGGSVWNRPSDNDPARPNNYIERGATNAFVVMARPGAPVPPAAPEAPTGILAPEAIKPMSAPPPASGDSDGSGTGPTPWFAGPMTVDGDAPLIGPDQEPATVELPVGRSASPSATGTGREATPNNADGPAGPAEDDRSLIAAETRSQPDHDGDRSPSGDDHHGSTLSAAAPLGTPTAPDGTGRRWPQPLGAVLGGAALAAATGLATRTRRQRQDDLVEPVDAIAGARLFDLTLLHGFYELVLDDETAQRREWDLNPRGFRPTVFKTDPFGHSGIPPVNEAIRSYRLVRL
jgi:Phosphodiester glycosidase